MKRIASLLLVVLAIIPAAAQEKARIVQSLNFGWRFHAGDVTDGENVKFDDSAWQTVNVHNRG